MVGTNKGIVEKIEHSIVVDILQIGVYGYFAYVFYTTLGYGDSVMEVSGEPNVIALQLALFLIGLNIVMLLHDKLLGGSSGPLG